MEQKRAVPTTERHFMYFMFPDNGGRCGPVFPTLLRRRILQRGAHRSNRCRLSDRLPPVLFDSSDDTIQKRRAARSARAIQAQGMSAIVYMHICIWTFNL